MGFRRGAGFLYALARQRSEQIPLGHRSLPAQGLHSAPQTTPPLIVRRPIMRRAHASSCWTNVLVPSSMEMLLSLMLTAVLEGK